MNHQYADGNKKSGVGWPLGPDYETKIGELIDDWIEHIRDGNGDTPESRSQFKYAEPHLRKQCKTRLETHERLCSEIRFNLMLSPFKWESETTDRIQQALNGKFPQQRKANHK